MLLNTVLERNEEIAYMLSGKIKYFMQIIPHTWNKRLRI